jgi:hypothetical protein
MAQTLLQIVTRACDELGLTRPGTSGVFGSSIPQDRQMLGLMNAAGQDLVTSHQWSTLIATASVTLATASATYVLPTDFDRLIDNAGWDHTNKFAMHGNISPQRHQYWMSSGVITPFTSKEFRFKIQPGSSTFQVHPNPPTTADVLKFLYVKNAWVSGSGGTMTTSYAADGDTNVFSDNLMVKELKWRWRNAKGLDAADAISERNILYDKLVAADIGSPTIDMGGGMLDADFINIPEGNWNL